MKVRFGVCADLHTEFIHDAPGRMDQFLKDCLEHNVDFCVNLGDFCPPGETNLNHKNEILGMICSSSIPFRHVLGNHDMDESSKSEVLEFVGVVFPYKEAVYAIVTISEDGITIKGKDSEIVGALPESMNFKKVGFKEKITASIRQRNLELQKM